MHQFELGSSINDDLTDALKKKKIVSEIGEKSRYFACHCVTAFCVLQYCLQHHVGL